MSSATIPIYPPNVLCCNGRAEDWSEKQGSLLSLLPLELEEPLPTVSTYQSSKSEMLCGVSELKLLSRLLLVK